MNGVFTAQQLLEACVPLGTQHHSRELKARACRLVLLHGQTMSLVAAMLSVSPNSVSDWVDEVKLRMQLASSWKGEPTPAWVSDKPISAVDPMAVIRSVCEFMSVKETEYFGRGRHPKTVFARQVTVELLRRHTTLSYPEIAAAMNRPNHSSAITMHRKYDTRVDEDQWFGGTKFVRRDVVKAVEDRLGLGVRSGGYREERPTREQMDRRRRASSGLGCRVVDSATGVPRLAVHLQRAVRMGERPVAGGGSGGYEVEAG